MRPEGRGGIALVAVLWVLVLLSVVAAGFLYETRTETKLARNLVENAKARALADAGVHRAVLALMSPRTKGLLGPEIENLLKLAPDPGAARRRAEGILGREMEAGTLGPGAEAMFKQGWRADGTVYAWAFGGGEVRISIEDEGGKIDLNRAPDELLKGLFVVVGVDEGEAARLVDAIADFRDADDVRRLDGAEDDDYRAAGLAWEAKDAPFAAVDELQRVMGMTPELYAKAAPFVTVHSKRRGIDPRTAPEEVLRAIPGVNQAEVEALIAARGQETSEGPEIAPPNRAGSALRSESLRAGRQDIDERQLARQRWLARQRRSGNEGDASKAALALPPLSGVDSFLARSRGSTYTVRAEARTEGGALFVREVVVRLTGKKGKQPFRLLGWRQGRLPASAAAQ